MNERRTPMISTEAHRQLAELFAALVQYCMDAPTTAHAVQATGYWGEMFEKWLASAAVLDVDVEVFKGDHPNGQLDARTPPHVQAVVDIGFPKRFTFGMYEVFTLCPESDPFAPIALRAYASACRTTMPALAAEFTRAAAQWDHRNVTRRTVRFFGGPRSGQEEVRPTPLPSTIQLVVLLPGALNQIDESDNAEPVPTRVEHYDFELDTGGFVIYRHRPDGDGSAAASMPKDSREEGAPT